MNEMLDSLIEAVRQRRKVGGCPVVICHPRQVQRLSSWLAEVAREGETVTVYPRSEAPEERDGVPVVYVVDLVFYFDQLFSSGEIGSE